MVRTSALRILLVGLALAACGDEAIILAPAQLAELCGETGPVQILALDPTRALARVDHLRIHDDRHLLWVSYRGDEVTLGGFPAIGEQELWAVGPCGETPVLLHQGQPRLIGLSKVWRDDLFVCDDTSGDVSIVDPFGEIPSRRVFQTSGCIVKATQVSDFAVDPSGRWIAWQTLVEDPISLDGPVDLLDRETGVITPLGEASILQTILDPFEYVDLGLLHVRRAADASDRFFRLDAGLESFDAPSGRWVRSRIGDSRVILAHDWLDGPFEWLDLDTAATGPLFAAQGSLRQIEDEMLVVEGVTCCADESANRRVGKLWRVSDEASPQLLARRVTLGYEQGGDGRIITPVDVRSDWTSSLIIVDPDTLDERVIDASVLRFSPGIVGDIEGDPVVLYTGVDAQEQGVWLARVAE